MTLIKDSITTVLTESKTPISLFYSHDRAGTLIT